MKQQKLYITNHAVERYIDRYNPALSSIPDDMRMKKQARYYINLLIKESPIVETYNGDLIITNPEYNLQFVVRKKRLVTLYTLDKRRRKYMDGNKDLKITISMPDGSKWSVSFATLVVLYLAKKGVDLRSFSEEKDKHLPGTIDEQIELFRSELDWRDIQKYSTCIHPARSVDYESGWRNGAFQLEVG